MAFDETWEEIHKETEWGHYPSETIIRFVARNYYKSNRSQVKILDYGCGGGAHTWYLAREGFDTYAFDGSKSAIEKLKLYLEKEKLSAHLSVMDGVSLDYSDCTFDAVIDNVCIYANRYEDIKKMYKECYRVLKCGGKIISTVFSKTTFGYKDGVEIEKDTYTDITVGRLAGRGTTHFFGREEIEKIITDAGFTDIAVDTIDYTDGGDRVGMLAVIATKRP